MSAWKAVVSTPDAGEAEALIEELGLRGISTDRSTGDTVAFSFATDGAGEAAADATLRELISAARQRAGMIELDLTNPRWTLEQTEP